MQYRTWDKEGISPSLLGFGCMRFPTLEDGRIDRKRAGKLLDLAIEGGVTYIDTAYPYHNQESESFLGEYLKKYDRKRFYLATKFPIWLAKTKEDVEKYFEEQLAKLQTDYFDFYLIHALDRRRLEKMKELSVYEKLGEYKKEGRIRRLGFSFHDSYDVFETLIKSYPWDFAQIQYNYMDTDYQAGDRGVKLAGEMGIPLVVMEPVRGGSLLRLPEDVKKLFADANPKASLASWPFRWVLGHPQVKVVLSGMGEEGQVRDNLATFSSAAPLTEEEKQVIAKAKRMLEERQRSRCTGCEYCMPCPFGVDIPSNFKYWNEDSIYLDDTGSRHYKELKEKRKATNCRQCGKCEEACPQHLSIREDLKKVAGHFRDVSC